MDKEQTKRAIEVMQAWVEGRAIQSKARGSVWYEITPQQFWTWDWERWDFRIKPEPREIWVNEYDAMFPQAHSTRELAMRHACDPERMAVHYREVIE